MREHVSARLRYWRQLLGGWWTLAAAVVTIVGVVDTVLAHWPTTPSVPPPQIWHLPHLPLPWWLFIIVLTLLIGVLEKSYRLHRDQQDVVSKQGTPDLGQQLVALSQDVLSFFEDRAEIASERPTVPAGTDAYVRWQEDVADRRQTTAKFHTKFAPRVFAALVRLESLGFNIPFHVRAGLGYDSTVGKYLGAVGELLIAGEFEKAKQISDTSAFYMLG